MFNSWVPASLLYSSLFRTKGRDRNLEKELRSLNEELERKVLARTEEISRNEVLFHSLIENSVEGISLMDASSHVIYRSPSAFRVIGNSPLFNSISFAIPMTSASFRKGLQNPSANLAYLFPTRSITGIATLIISGPKKP